MHISGRICEYNFPLNVSVVWELAVAELAVAELVVAELAVELPS